MFSSFMSILSTGPEQFFQKSDPISFVIPHAYIAENSRLTGIATVTRGGVIKGSLQLSSHFIYYSTGVSNLNSTLYKTKAISNSLG